MLKSTGPNTEPWMVPWSEECKEEQSPLVST